MAIFENIYLRQTTTLSLYVLKTERIRYEFHIVACTDMHYATHTRNRAGGFTKVKCTYTVTACSGDVDASVSCALQADMQGCTTTATARRMCPIQMYTVTACSGVSDARVSCALQVHIQGSTTMATARIMCTNSIGTHARVYEDCIVVAADTGTRATSTRGAVLPRCEQYTCGQRTIVREKRGAVLSPRCQLHACGLR